MFGLEPHLEALAIIITFVIAARIGLWVFEKIFLRAASLTKTDLDDVILKKINRPITVIILLYGFKLGLETLGFDDLITKAFTSVACMIAGYVSIVILTAIIENWAKKWAEKTESKTDDHLINLLEKIIKILIFIFVILYLLAVWGVEITPMLTGLGVGGLIIGLALQKPIGNLFGGMTLIIDKTAKIGDVITLEDGTVGTVLDIGIRSTKIKTFDNEVMIMPSGTLAESKIINRAKPDPKLRVVIPFGVAYGSDVDKVKAVVMEELKALKVLDDPAPMVRFTEMGDSALLFKGYFWVNTFKEAFMKKDEANTRIYNKLNKEGISIPFPQMDVHLKKE